MGINGYESRRELTGSRLHGYIAACLLEDALGSQRFVQAPTIQHTSSGLNFWVQGAAERHRQHGDSNPGHGHDPASWT